MPSDHHLGNKMVLVLKWYLISNLQFTIWVMFLKNLRPTCRLPLLRFHWASGKKIVMSKSIAHLQNFSFGLNCMSSKQTPSSLQMVACMITYVIPSDDFCHSLYSMKIIKNQSLGEQRIANFNR